MTFVSLLLGVEVEIQRQPWRDGHGHGYGKYFRWRVVFGGGSGVGNTDPWVDR